MDYRYADAGGSNDPPYTAGRGYGYLNGVANTRGVRCRTKNVRENQSGNTVSYRYDGLLQSKRYQVNLTFYQEHAAARSPRRCRSTGWTPAC